MQRSLPRYEIHKRIEVTRKVSKGARDLHKMALVLVLFFELTEYLSHSRLYMNKSSTSASVFVCLLVLFTNTCVSKARQGISGRTHVRLSSHWLLFSANKPLLFKFIPHTYNTHTHTHSPSNFFQMESMIAEGAPFVFQEVHVKKGPVEKWLGILFQPTYKSI